MNGETGPSVVLRIGAVPITDTVITSLALLAFCALLFSILARYLRRDNPSGVQSALEGVVLGIERAIAEVAPEHARRILPFVGTLWIYLVLANLIGLIPALHSPTRDLSTTSALAILVFLSVHWYGIRFSGLGPYLRHYLSPSPILLPFHVLSEITRTVALAVRLFGNIMSLEMAAMLILLVAGFLAPVPILMLHVVEALVQAYIFGMLALIYIASGVQYHQDRHSIAEESVHE